MKPLDFPEANVVLGPPANKEKDIIPLPAFRGRDTDDNPVIVSLWEISEDEIAQLWETRRLWVRVYGNVTPPILPQAEFPFVK